MHRASKYDPFSGDHRRPGQTELTTTASVDSRG